MYVGNSGKITFTAADANGQIVSTTTINATATRTMPAAGAQNDDPNDKGAVYNLNLTLPAAGSYTILAVFDSTATLFRSNAGVNGYPFKVGNIFSITGNTATDDASATDTTYYQGYYYYFYDVKLKSAGCASAGRTPVTLTKPVITQNGSILNSNSAAGNHWYLNGTVIPGATSASYSPIQSGNYSVGVILNTSCEVMSDPFMYALVAKNPSNGTDIGLAVFPVPTTGLLNVVFAAKADNNLTLSLINAAGLTVYKNEKAITAGDFSTVVDGSKVAPGTYVLKVQIGQKIYSNKVIIIR
jgi:hypothetical protein